jgi:hypothetical protein
MQAKRHPIQLNVTIEPASMKKIVEQGRLSEFADALPTLVAAHIKAQLVDKVASGGAAGFSFTIGFDDDDRYGTPPKPWPWPRGIWEDALREVAIKDVVQRFGR